MTTGAVEGASLIDGAVAVDDNVSAGTLGGTAAPKIDGGFSTGTAGKVDDEESPHGHFRATGNRAAESGGEPVIGGDVHEISAFYGEVVCQPPDPRGQKWR